MKTTTTTLAAFPVVTAAGNVTLPAGSAVTAWVMADRPGFVGVESVGPVAGRQSIKADRAAVYLRDVPSGFAAPAAPAVPAVRVSSMLVSDKSKKAALSRGSVMSRGEGTTGAGRTDGTDRPLTSLNFSDRDYIVNTEARMRPLANVGEVMREAHLDWTVSKHEAVIRDPSTGAMVSTGHSAILRDDTRTVLGVVSNRYEPVQNAEGFALLDVLREAGAEFVGAGSFSEGATVFVQMDLGTARDIVPGDGVSGYMLVRNSHDGTGAYIVRCTPVRVVCYNTLTHASFSKVGAIFGKLKHTKNVRAAVADVRRAIEGLKRQTEAAFDTFAALAAKPVTKELVDGLFADIGVFQLPEEPEADRARANAIERRESVIELFEGKGAGAALPGVRGTAWGLYNAVTEWADWQFAANARTPDARNESRLIGRATDVKEDALEYLTGSLGIALPGAAR